MILRIILLAVFCLPYLNFRLLCNSDNFQFTSLEIGDSLKTIGKDYYNLRLYVFLNDASCISCMPVLKDISEILKKESKLQAIAFYNSENTNNMIKFKESYPDYSYIQDPLGAYKDIYKINEYPVILILDKAGKLLFQGCPTSKNNFDSKLFKKVLTNIRTQNNENSKSLILKKEVILQDSLGQNLSFNARSCVYIPDEDKYLVFYDDRSIIYILNSDFKVENSYYIDTKNENYMFMILSEGRNSSKFIKMCIVNDSLGIKYCIYDTEKKELNNYAAKEYEVPTMLCGNTTANKDSIVLFKTEYTHNIYSTEIDSIPSNIYYNTSSKKFVNIGKIEKVALQNEIYYHFSNIVNYIDDKNNIFFAQTLADTFRIFNLAGDLKKSIYLEFDSTCYKSKPINYLNSIKTSYEKNDLEETVYHVSLLRKIIKDEPNDKLYIVYSNYFKTVTGAKVIQRYLHCYDLKLDKFNSHDIILPGSSNPMSINNNILSTFENIGGKIIFRKYEIVK